MMENNTFTLTFGQSPTSYIQREKEIDQILSNFSLDFPLSHIYIISGVRGSGKTVLLTNAANRFKKLDSRFKLWKTSRSFKLKNWNWWR